MTIVAAEDTRNKDWAKDSIGSKLLSKMGWKEGNGLGRRQQGQAVPLRALRKMDSSGIGSADADTTGSQGWGQTTDSFHSVLANLQAHHGSTASSNSDTEGDKKKSKKKKKKKKLVLAQNKVTAGHSRKMREAKDLKTKSDHDMAAIFGGTTKVPRSSSKRKREQPTTVITEEAAMKEYETIVEGKTSHVEAKASDALFDEKLKKDKKKKKSRKFPEEEGEKPKKKRKKDKK